MSKNSLKHKLPIVSEHNNRYLYMTIFLWGLITIIVMFSHCPTNDKEVYNTQGFLIYLGVAVACLGLILLIQVSTRYVLIIDSEKMVLKNSYGKVVETYTLKNITQFTWDNRPRRGISQGGSTPLTEHQSIEITFSDKEDPIYLDMERYSNIEEIRCYLYDYCLENRIIHK